MSSTGFVAFFVCLALFCYAVRAQEPKPNATLVKAKVCDVCSCAVNYTVIDCSNRNLNSSLKDYDWPSDPIQLVNFTNNNIENIDVFPNLTISVLNFCNNSIKTIENHAFKFLTNFTELDLSHNLLSYDTLSPHAFRGRYSSESYEPLRKLRKLNLAWNNLTSLRKDMFMHVADLTSLNLSHNPLGIIDQYLILELNTLAYLKELDISSAKLKSIDAGALHNLRNLKKLDLGGNLFAVLPHVLEDLNSLESLILDSNPIEALNAENGFPTLSNLKELSMSNMPRLSSIGQNSLCHLQALQVLRIENCKNLTEIDEFAFAKKNDIGGYTWPPLRTLNISNNSLHFLGANFIANWDDLKEMHLTNNQWYCDCDNQDLIGLILPKEGKRLMGNETSELLCAYPPEHENRTLESLATWHLRCPDMYGARPERDAAILVGMLVGILVAIPLVATFFILWRRGFFFCGPQGPASFSRAFYRRAPPCEDDF